MAEPSGGQTRIGQHAIEKRVVTEADRAVIRGGYSSMTLGLVAKCIAYALLWANMSYSALAENTLKEQKFPAKSCINADNNCVEKWFKEYKSGIIEEFIFYRSLEDRLAGVIASKNEMQAYALNGEFMKNGAYRHLYWDMIKDPQVITQAEIPLAKWEALTWSCRTSIIQLKYATIDVASHPEDLAQDLKAYREEAPKCEKAFAIQRQRSTLRP